MVVTLTPLAQQVLPNNENIKGVREHEPANPLLATRFTVFYHCRTHDHGIWAGNNQVRNQPEMPENGKPNGRFELPAFTPVNYSLTDGTNIPPPPASPIDEKPPAPKPEPVTIAPVVTNGAATTENVGYEGRGRTTNFEIPPMSPVSTRRPSSIRRFLSRKSLNVNYTNGTHGNESREELAGIERPESSMSFVSVAGGSKKSGGWFRRFSSRNSVIQETKEDKQVPMGPPPPKLPELSQLKAKVEDEDEGMGAEDMFKNIK
ncbi:hypothetical protein B7494_g7159 [Chlorociboria aeruginascens]|nr:hypothetical protein B7494_g7159 [Chlorociboria aeruginascens]